MSADTRKRSRTVSWMRGKGNRRIGLALIAISVVLAILTGVYLWIIAENMKMTTELWNMHLELNEIRNENAELEVKIAQASSINSLIERSLSLGYQPATSVEFVQEP